jgi:VWFA-related protein
MLARRHFVYGLAGLCAGRLLGQDDPRFSTEASLVELQVIVRDRDGRIVTDLGLEDFAIEDQGRPVPIRFFSRQSDPPLFVGLALDSSGSIRDLIGDEVKAAREFLRQVLRPSRDQAFVIRFDSRVELMQDLTPLLELLEDGLEQIGRNQHGVTLPRDARFPFSYMPPRPARPVLALPSPSRGVPLPLPPPSALKPVAQAATCLYDAVFLSSAEILGAQTGRKAIILASDGLDSGSRVSLEAAIEEAQRAGAQVYSIRFANNERALEIPSPALERLAAATGGAYYQRRRGQSLGRIFGQIQDELRNQYSLAFTPAPGESGYRRIRVTVNRPGFIARTREGYHAGK